MKKFILPLILILLLTFAFPIYAVTYDTKYEGNVEPDSDGWTLSGTDYASSDGDILTIDTSADVSYVCYYYKNPDIDFDSGFYAKFRIRVNSAVNYGFIVNIEDGTQDEKITLYLDTGKIYDTLLSEIGSIDLTSFVVVEVYVKDTTAKVYTNGSLLGSFSVYSGSVNDRVYFGDGSGNKSFNANLDYFYYALDIDYNPAEEVEVNALFWCNF